MGAWIEGYQAYETDGLSADNPYPEGSDDAHKWDCGASASEDDEEYCIVNDM